jgi:hypothetical protein
VSSMYWVPAENCSGITANMNPQPSHLTIGNDPRFRNGFVSSAHSLQLGHFAALAAVTASSGIRAEFATPENSTF